MELNWVKLGVVYLLNESPELTWKESQVIIQKAHKCNNFTTENR